MLIGKFEKYHDLQGTIRFDEEDKIYYGEIINTSDSVSYHGESFMDLAVNYLNAIDNYLEEKQKL